MLPSDLGCGGANPVAVNSLQQSILHALHFDDADIRAVVGLRSKKPKVTRQQKLIFQFACRAKRDLHKLRNFGLSASTSFGEVCWNRRSRTPNLARQPKHLRPGKVLGQTVGVEGETMRLVPHCKISKVLHSRLQLRWMEQSETGCFKMMAKSHKDTVPVGAVICDKVQFTKRYSLSKDILKVINKNI